MAGEKERVAAYLSTIERFEPDIALTDTAAFGTSVAISLKRIADALERRPTQVLWHPLSSLPAFLQTVAQAWVEKLLPGDWCHKSFTNEDGSIIVLYYKQPQKEIVWTKLLSPFERT
jgi:hypothetical protein